MQISDVPLPVCPWVSSVDAVTIGAARISSANNRLLFRNVQALRAIAALLVIGVHMGAENGFEARYIADSRIVTAQFGNVGYFGVDLFFVISGFIMTVTMWNAFAEPKASMRFLLRRIIRIYVPYWLVFFPIFAVWIVRPSLVDSHTTLAPDVLASLLLLPQNGEPLLLVSWTLVFEMAFYCVFAVALCFPRRTFPLILAVWLATIVTLGATLPTTQNAYLRFLENPLAIEFFFGVAAGTLIAHRRLGWLWPSLFAGSVLLAGLVALTMRAGVTPDLWTRVSLAGPGFGLVLYAAVVAEARDGYVFPNWIDALGDASYALYLWHIPILSALGLMTLRLHVANGIVHVALVIADVAFVAGAALFIYRFIERPAVQALQLRSAGWFALRRAPRSRASAVAARDARIGEVTMDGKPPVGHP